MKRRWLLTLASYVLTGWVGTIPLAVAARYQRVDCVHIVVTPLTYILSGVIWPYLFLISLVTGMTWWVKCVIGMSYLSAWKLMPLLLNRLTPKPYPPGLCPTCGYDLRATPSRCPECGTVMGERKDEG